MQIKKGVNINHALNIDLTFVNVKLKYLQMLTNQLLIIINGTKFEFNLCKC